MPRTVDTSWGKYLSFCLQITNTADCIPTQRCSMLIILSCLLHSALPLYPLPRHDLNTALLIWMPGFVSTVYVIILANPRLSWLVHVSIYCHFRLSPVPIAPSSPVTVTDQVTTPGIKRFTFDPRVSALCQKSFFYLCTMRHTRCFLTDNTAASTARTMVLSCLDYSNFWLFSFQHSKTPMISKYCCPDCFEHTTTVPFPAVATADALVNWHLFPYQV